MTPSESVRGGMPARASYGEAPKSADRRDAWRQLDRSSVMTVELVAAILVWGGLGWVLDTWLGTWPWLMATGVMVGFAAGLYLIWLRTSVRVAPEPATGRHQGDGASMEG